MIAAVGGTFNVIHDGHKALLQRAFELGDRVFICITTDEFALTERDTVNPIDLRKRELIDYIAKYDVPWEIYEIDDIYGPKPMIDVCEVLVVSEETYLNGLKVNNDRVMRGVAPIELEVVSLVKCPDGEKISARDIISGRYAKDGNPDHMDIVVGSTNPIKVEAVRTVMEKIFGHVRISAIEVDTGVPPQPFESQTREGAINRAKNALGDHELSVGIEAGVFEKEDGLYDYQYCAVLDRTGRITIGTGMGFRYPDEVADVVRSGLTVGQAMDKVYGVENIGHHQGAIGLLSQGLIDRKGLTEQSVTAAMVPRLWKE